MKSETIIPGTGGKPILLDITYDELSGAHPVVVYAHGFNGFKDWGNFDLIASQFVAAGFTFVKFNFSHNGTSPEAPQDFVALDTFAENNYTKELADLGLVLDWVTAAGNAFASFIEPGKIGLIGHSMGGGISILKTAADRRINALVTWASISECKTPWGSWDAAKMQEWKEKGTAWYFNGRTRQQMPMHYQLYEDYIAHAAELDIIAAARNIEVPFLICHGSEDTGVPLSNAHTLHEAAAASELFVVPSDHVFGRRHPWTEGNLPVDMQQVVDANVAFFARNL